MSSYLIGVHVKRADGSAVRQAATAVFEAAGFALLSDLPLFSVIEDEDLLPAGDDWYGAIVSGVAGTGWVSVYVRDWPDSGALAQGVSERLGASALEIWVAEDRHWGYAYYEAGAVRDRFADAPLTVAETAAEAALYEGRPATLLPVLAAPVAQAEAALAHARGMAGQFAGAAVDAFAETLGLPYEHAYQSYDGFFDADPEDYADDLEDWPQFRHLAFAAPPGREGLME